MTEKFDPFNLTDSQEDHWAVHLPAFSGFYIQQMAKLDDNPDHYGPDRFGPTFDKGHRGLDFYNGGGYFTYKWGLYSAGHAKLDIEKSKESERFVQSRKRDGSTFLLGDSGGFQIAKGAGHFKNVDWSDFEGAGGDKIREKVLRWLEETSDFSMTLDIPAFAAEPPLSLKTGLTSFGDTLDLSLLNLYYFVKNRVPGKTKFLNVLSGTNFENSSRWYEGVKAFSDPIEVEKMDFERERTLEGYAFAGINMKHMPSVLARMADLLRDDLIKDKEWIHFLGIGRLDWACYLTSIQRQLRNYEPKITVSFDCASAFLAVAKGQMYSNPSYTPKRFGYNMNSAIDDRNLKESTLQMPFPGPIASRMNLGHMCRLGPGEHNKQGKLNNTSWDTASYLLGMASNVYIHVNAVQEANRMADMEYTKFNLSYKDWSKQKRGSQVNEVSDFVPANILFFNSFVESFFDNSMSHEDRMSMIEDNRQFLEAISFGGQKGNVFGNLFDMSDITTTETEAVDAIASYADVDDLDED